MIGDKKHLTMGQIQTLNFIVVKFWIAHFEKHVKIWYWNNEVLLYIAQKITLFIIKYQNLQIHQILINFYEFWLTEMSKEKLEFQ
jgi:hypothetical protein